VALFVSTTLNGKRAEEALIDFSLGQFGKEYNAKLKLVNPQIDLVKEDVKNLFDELKFVYDIVPRVQNSAYIKQNGEYFHFTYQGLDLIKEAKYFKESNKSSKLNFSFISKSLYDKLKNTNFEYYIDDQKFILENFEVIESVGGLYIIEDLETAQEKLNRYNFTYLLLKFESNEENLKSLKNFAKDKYEIETIEDIKLRSANALKSFHMNLIIISLISILIAFFMVSNSMSGIFISRKKEFGIFRCLGFSKIENLFLFFSQTVLLGILGTSLGIILGIQISKLQIFSGESTVIDMNLATTYSEVSSEIILISYLIGIFGSFFSGLIPALKAYSIEPISLIKEVEYNSSFKQDRIFFILGLSLIIISIQLSKIKSPFELPIYGFASVGLIIIGVTACFPFSLKLILNAFNYLFSKLENPNIAIRIGLEEIVQNSVKNSLTAATLMLGVSLILSLSTLTDAYEKSISDWTEREFPFEYSIINQSDVDQGTDFGIPIDLVEKLKSIEFVKNIDIFSINTKVPIKNKTFTIHIHDLKLASIKEREYNRKTYPENLTEKDILISSNMAYLNNLKIGDSIPINTSLGLIHFRILGIREHFFSETGTIMMDYRVYKKYFDLDKYKSIRFDLQTNDRDKVIKELNQLLQFDPNLRIIDSNQLKALYLSGVKKVFKTLHSLKFTALLLSLLSILSSLTYNLLDKLKTLAALKSIGASLEQLIILVFSENLFIISFGVLSGLLLSLILNPIILGVINKAAFGWTLYSEIPKDLLSYVLLGIPFISFFTLFYPFYVLKKMRLREILSYE
jgi:putative ABC transport system permease protein